MKVAKHAFNNALDCANHIILFVLNLMGRAYSFLSEI